MKAPIPVCILFCMHWQLYTDIRVDEGVSKHNWMPKCCIL
jgi:hypothetical protein